MDEKIMDLFLNKGYSTYGISIELDCSIKQVYHVIKQHEEQVRAAKKKEHADAD